MIVQITFDSRADLSPEYRAQIDGSCLTLRELGLSGWRDRKLIYWTTRSASEVVGSWESVGFSFDEFERVEFMP